MKTRVAILVTFIFSLLCLRQAEGQGFTTKGTDFWFAFMENYLGEDTIGSDRMKVYITTDFQTATGTISAPLGGWSQNFVVPPNSTVEITIPTVIAMCTRSDTIENRGIHVVSDNPVSVYQLNYVQYTSDANINIPTISLGKSYRVTTYQPSSASMAWTEVSISELVIVAAYNNTVIRVVPKCNTQGGHGANVPFTITLNQGQVYQIKSYPSSQYSLTGTLVEIDTNANDNCKTFALFSGNLCAFVPGDSCCCNNICEQMMPINTWGKQYVTVPLKTRASDVFRFVGQKNGTIFTINGGPPIGLNAGSYYEQNIANASFIDSNYPISVAQLSKSAGTDGNVNSDPFMIMLNPLEQTIRRIVFNSFVTSIISAYYVNIVTRTAYTNLVTLDGTGIAAAFLPVPGNPTYSYAQKTISQGNHVLKSDSGLIANVYGYGYYETYGYIAGATVNNLEITYNVISPTDTVRYYDLLDTICRGTPLTFAASHTPYITDYFWNFGDGSPIVHGQTVTHTYTNAGDFKITYYYQRNSICALDSIVWTIHIKCCNPPPVLNATSPLCVGVQTTITETGTTSPTATYTWDFNGGTIASGSGQGPYQVSWNGIGFDTVWVYVSEPNCETDSASYIIEVKPIPSSTFSLVSPLCAGEQIPIVYTGNASAGANYVWDFDGGSVASGTGQGPYEVIWTTGGTHTVTLTVTDYGCSSTSTEPASIYAPPYPHFTANPQTTFVDEPLIHFFDNSTNTSTWEWNFGDAYSGFDNFSTLPSPMHTYNTAGTYTVWLIAVSPNGCIDSVAMDIQILEYNTFYIPNAFIPNDNHINDIFEPYGINLNYTLYIFNRWGEEIFKGENKGWDGKYKGKKVEQDLFVWRLDYSFSDKLQKVAYGIVTLLK